MARADRDERVRRLTEKARERSAESLAAARRAIMTLQARQQPITPTSVAREAGVSVSYLSSHPELREEIRASAPSGRRLNKSTSASPSAESLRTQLDVMKNRLRDQKAELARLHRENAALRGEVLELRRVARRTGT